MVKTFTGRPCKNCDNTERFERDGKCVRCVRARGRVANMTLEQISRARTADRVRSALPHRRAQQARLRAKGYHNEWQRRSHEKDPRKRMLKHAQERAAKYGRACTISLDDIVIPTHCPVLGIPILLGSRKSKDVSPTLDRKNSGCGYVPGNVWVISWKANVMKRDMSPDELIFLGTRLKELLANVNFEERDDAPAYVAKVYRKLSNEDIRTIAASFSKRSAFKEADPSAYRIARRRGILDGVCAHMDLPRHVGSAAPRRALDGENATA